MLYGESNGQQMTSLSPSKETTQREQWSLYQNLNTTSRHLNISHPENRETHSKIVVSTPIVSPKSDPYPCLDIARQEKESATATSTTFLLEIPYLFTENQYLSHLERTSTVLKFQRSLHRCLTNIDLFTESSIRSTATSIPQRNHIP